MDLRTGHRVIIMPLNSRGQRVKTHNKKKKAMKKKPTKKKSTKKKSYEY